jgi:hypothetical protein
LVGKPEEKRPFGGPRRKWEDNIKMDVERKSYWRVHAGLIWLRI